jgi:hypothetical protein
MKMKLFLALTTAMLAGFLICPAHARLGLAPDADGYIRDWLLLAPIPLSTEGNGAEEIDKPQLAGEAALKPKAGDAATVDGKTLNWRAVNSSDAVLDVNKALNGQYEQSVAYAVCYVVAPEALTGLKLKMGSNDQAKIYLNGKEVLKFAETRVLEKDSDTADNVTLAKGVNVVVFKIINEMNNWQGCLRFVTADGKPVKGYEVKLTP